VTLFNPLTYAAEGLRHAMVPAINGHELNTLGIGWVLAALVASIFGTCFIGARTFRKRVIS